MKKPPQTLLALFVLATSACSGTPATQPGQSPGVVTDPDYTYKTQAEIPISLVQSVPAETDLAVPGMLHAAQVWVEMVQGAERTLDIGQMYVSNSPDRTGALEPVIQALIAAGKRGVMIRFIISKQMQDTDKVTLARIKEIENIEVRVLDLGKLTGGIQHAKYWVIDGRSVFVGSQNFDHLALSQIHEMGLKIDHVETARRLTQVFEMDWEMARTGSKPAVTVGPFLPKLGTDIEISVSPSDLLPKGMRPSLPDLVALLKSAKKKIQIQTMIYSPVEYSDGFWGELDQPIRDAATRGVQVEIVVSHWNTDQPNVEHLKSLSLVPNVTLKICTIPLLKDGSYTPYSRVTHSKYAIFDGERAFIGTSNWSKGYFYGSRNVDFVTQRVGIVSGLEQVFARVWSAPYSEPIRVDFRYPKPRKF